MRTTLRIPLLVAAAALLGGTACRKAADEPPRDVTAVPTGATAEVTVGGEEVEIPIKFGGKITRKTQPLRTKVMEERLSKVIRSNDKTSPASMLILEDGSITVDVCREGFDRRRRVDAASLTATVWIGPKSYPLELKAVAKTRDESGNAFRFQARWKQILCGEKMMVVVDVPNDAGDALERATFVVPAGFEPY
ncbi:MAG: hypothetical protein ACF8XB_03115 [Planctomycetota bacterium JB042]